MGRRSVAFLFGEKSLRPWPKDQRRALLLDGEALTSKDSADTQWWINSYRLLDPVSGALGDPFICGDQPPSNIHIGLWLLPGLAHVAYWRDAITLRFVLGRAFGTRYLYDREFRPLPLTVQVVLAALGYFIWAGLIVGALIVLYEWGPVLLREAMGAVLGSITGWHHEGAHAGSQ